MAEINPEARANPRLISRLIWDVDGLRPSRKLGKWINRGHRLDAQGLTDEALIPKKTGVVVHN